MQPSENTIQSPDARRNQSVNDRVIPSAPVDCSHMRQQSHINPSNSNMSAIIQLYYYAACL